MLQKIKGIIIVSIVIMFLLVFMVLMTALISTVKTAVYIVHNMGNYIYMEIHHII